ncbi:MAG TPA: hypothetical protein VMU09_08300 [Acidimicrobiales bacterium]|nr:hypothetical protein [Acidimicrobiales bacterium]
MSGERWARRLRCQDATVLVGDWPPPEERGRRVVAFCEVVGGRAVVLGSGQRDEDVDRVALARSGRALARRTSGGGAVQVGPGEQAWVEVWLPRGDPLWDDDVVRSSWWLGDAWVRALGRLGVVGASVHRDRAVRNAWSEVVCFAGMGPGEVAVGGRKLVGISQRRTRQGARFQSMAAVRWAPDALVPLWAPEVCDALDPAELARSALGLVDAIGPAGTVDDVRLGERVGEAVLDALP